MNPLIEIDDPPYVRDIPTHTMGSIARYVLQGIHPGDFVWNCIRNDLKMAVAYADRDNAAALKPIVMLLVNRIPSGCWGNEDKALAWIKKFQSEQNHGDETSNLYPYLRKHLRS